MKESRWIVIRENEFDYYVEDLNNVSPACWHFEKRDEAQSMANLMNKKDVERRIEYGTLG